MCFDQRLGQSVWIQCRDFASAYQQAMNGMVEKDETSHSFCRRLVVFSMGRCWFTHLDFSQDIKTTWIVDSMVIKYDAIKEKVARVLEEDKE